MSIDALASDASLALAAVKMTVSTRSWGTPALLLEVDRQAGLERRVMLGQPEAQVERHHFVVHLSAWALIQKARRGATRWADRFEPRASLKRALSDAGFFIEAGTSMGTLRVSAARYAEADELRKNLVLALRAYLASRAASVVLAPGPAAPGYDG